MSKMLEDKPLVEHMVLRCAMLIEFGHFACALHVNEPSVFE
jgi:hypothetical protein